MQTILRLKPPYGEIHDMQPLDPEVVAVREDMAMRENLVVDVEEEPKVARFQKKASFPWC